jgi:hypothetical protein
MYNRMLVGVVIMKSLSMIIRGNEWAIGLKEEGKTEKK